MFSLLVINKSYLKQEEGEEDCQGRNLSGPCHGRSYDRSARHGIFASSPTSWHILFALVIQ